MARHEQNQKKEVVQQQDMEIKALTVSPDVETRLGDVKSLLQRLADLDSDLAKQSSLRRRPTGGWRS